MKDRRRTTRPSPPEQTVVPENLLRPGFATAMRLERDHLFDSGYFSKAPTLMRLLAFLVEETLAGKGDGLKSYSVAVDGLGREPDFDSQADSYPRVQVVRLRKLLESFYARHEPAEGSCIFLKPGSYRVRLGPITAAYPELVRGHHDGAVSAYPQPKVENALATTVAGEFGSNDPTITLELPPNRINATQPNFRLRDWRLIAGVLLILAIAFLVYSLNAPDKPSMQQRAPAQLSAPVLLLEPVTAAPDPRSTVLANSVYAVLADGIGRSWLVRLRLENAAAVSANTPKPKYTISVQLGEANEISRPIFLRLTEYESSDLLWSTNVDIKPDASIADTLGQAIAQLTGPFGVIAARETRIAQGRYGSGYSCLLGYLAYVATTNSKVDDSVAKCLNKENADAKLDAVRLAFQSFLLIEADADESRRREQVNRAMNVARQSIRTDPKEAYAHFAMARINFVSGNCPIGQQHSAHAMEANPYDPVILAVLGNFAATCGYKDGLAMLDKAYALRSPGESHARLSLILAAIWQKRFDRLEILREDGSQNNGTSAAYDYLCETLIAAALDQTPAARANWQKFKSSPHARTSSDDAMLSSVIMSPEVRARIKMFLKMKNVL